MSSAPAVQAAAALPAPRGPLSESVIGALATTPDSGSAALAGTAVTGADPYGDDLHLALYVCYELHYRSFVGVDDAWEWNTELLRLRGDMEALFLDHLRARVPAGGSVDDEMDALATEHVDGSGPSYHLRDHGTAEQMREYLAHRSLYHLKEADPHAWAIPRLQGQAKAAYVAVEFDEFGGGRGSRMHQVLFRDLLEAAGLDSSYLGYLDRVGAPTLAPVNLMSFFGLHRRWRGAAAGHLAATEITSSPGSSRLVAALRRLGFDERCVAFYAEHVEADAVHEQVMRHDVVGDLVTRDPALEADVVFGMRALGYVEDVFAAHLMDTWAEGRRTIEL
ncbi:iron-containing redox enzyme family protein [Rhodococcus kroppenstedtii]|uniref:Iron-containing redox enzyme family protein n=1 Tax=Rhodococcoides kroppenstedtii TaxID=293050 RepID=A0ABS7NRJ2_9NOCA|nr:iron-containing redox enzyme family protein [Rhodococcus kroppenstedtii]MBY6320352.1 iron-containing redox enzyme family protein [Rhodococcus kroppenstedtii]MBY6398627.1 iron-containing redox enzyme family protein [Rhodococcus kroppenstedtii]